MTFVETNCTTDMFYVEADLKLGIAGITVVDDHLAQTNAFYSILIYF